MLVGNTAIIGLLMASFALATPGEPLAARAATRGLRRLQFAAVHGHEHHHAQGPGRRERQQRQQPAVDEVQMLAMSLGVAVAGAVLSGFGAAFGGTGTPGAALEAFQAPS